MKKLYFKKHTYLKLALVLCAFLTYSFVYSAPTEYTLTADDITLSSEGYITSCSYDFSLNADGTDLIIPNDIGVYGIADEEVDWMGNFEGDPSFSGKNITSLTLPDDIIYIGTYAFKNNELCAIVLPEGLDEIERDAFMENHIAAIHIPSTVRSIGANCFHSNAELSSITFAENSQLVNIGSHVFVDTSITSISLPSPVVADNSFEHWIKIDYTNVIVQPGESVNPGNCAFVAIYNYTLTDDDVTIENGTIKSIDRNIYTRHLTIPTQINGEDIIGLKGVSSQQSGLFYAMVLYSVTLPEKLQTIGSFCFNTNYILNLEIPASVTEIGQYAFYGAFDKIEGIISFEDNSQLNLIEYRAFDNNGNLSLTLPASVKEGFTFEKWMDDNGNAFASGEVITNHTTEYEAKFQMASGIDPNFSSMNNITPNPTNGDITITNENSTAPVEVYSLTGSKVKTIMLQGITSNANISDLPNGIYIFAQSGKIIAKIVKQ